MSVLTGVSRLIGRYVHKMNEKSIKIKVLQIFDTISVTTIYFLIKLSDNFVLAHTLLNTTNSVTNISSLQERMLPS